MHVFTYRNDHCQQYANVELHSGDRLHVRVTHEKVEILKLRLGHIPLGVVWAAVGAKQMGRLAYSCRMSNRLDGVLEHLRECHCAAEVSAKLPKVTEA